MALARLAQATAEQRLQVMHGDLASAESTVSEAYTGLDLDDLSTHGAVHVPMADAERALAKGDDARATRLMDDLLTRLRPVGMRSFLPDALHLKAQALLAQGQTEAATQTLSGARAEAKSLGSRRMLWQILAALSAIEEGLGRFDEPQRLRAQARELIAYITGHMLTTALRDSFLRLPRARSVADAP